MLTGRQVVNLIGKVDLDIIVMMILLNLFQFVITSNTVKASKYDLSGMDCGNDCNAVQNTTINVGEESSNKESKREDDHNAVLNIIHKDDVSFGKESVSYVCTINICTKSNVQFQSNSIEHFDIMFVKDKLRWLPKMV